MAHVFYAQNVRMADLKLYLQVLIPWIVLLDHSCLSHQLIMF